MTVGENDGGENPRPISWIKAARKDFSKFPVKARQRMLTALEIAAAGQKADIAKRMKGLGAGVIEIALRYQTNAYRMIYALQLDQDIWVIHAFQKKSRTGTRTPKREIDKIRERIKTLKEMLNNE